MERYSPSKMFVGLNFLYLSFLGSVVLATKTNYTVITKTGAGPGCGTDAVFKLTIIGSNKNDSVTFLLDGKGDKLEVSNIDHFTYSGRSVYPLDRILLQRVEKKGWSPDWYVHWLTVEIQNTLYAFRINRWVRNDDVKLYYGTLGHCKEGFQRIQECRKIDSIVT